MNKNIDVSYKQAYDQFLEKLKECHLARGTPFGKVPTFGGQPLDLYALYNTVTSFGGISVVTDKRKWDQVFTALGFPPCLNAAYALRQHYCRYLEAYEKIYFFNEEADDSASPTDTPRSYGQIMKYRRINKPPKISTIGEPLVQNFNQIMFSLQSGLPNEIDFALNICSLLSNVSNSIFNLAKCPQVLSLMLAHVGIISNDNTFVDELCANWYSTRKDKNFQKFWALSLMDNSVFDNIKNFLKEMCLLQIPYMDEKSTKLFADKKNCKQLEANNSPEFARINQTCIIIYNFSFETINSMFLASHDGAKRFLMLCSSCKYNSIQRNGLDAFDNIAEHIILDPKEDEFTQCFMKLLDTFLKSEDKFHRVRAMSVIAKLASRECNKDVLVEILSNNSFQCIMKTLYLPDISLLLSALDAFYFLSALCTETSDCILSVHGCLEILLSLCTVRAESFGNQAIQGFRIVENKMSLFTPKNQMWLKSQEQKRMYHLSMSYPRPNNIDSDFPRQNLPMRPGLPNFPRPPLMVPPVIRPGMHPQIGPYGVPYFPRVPSYQHGVAPGSPHPSAARLPHHQIQLGFSPRFPPKPLGIPADPKAAVLSQTGSSLLLPASSDLQMPTNQSPNSDMVELDSNIFTAHWMSGFYEPHQTNKLVASFIYQDYVTVCKELKREGILMKDQFIMMLRMILPPHLVQFHEPDSNGDILLHGIQRRAMPVQVHSRVPRPIYQEIMRNKNNHLPAKVDPVQPINDSSTTNEGIEEKTKSGGESHCDSNNELNKDNLINGGNNSEQTITSNDVNPEKIVGNGPCSVPISKPSLTPTGMYAAIIGENKLSNGSECRTVIDKVKNEIQNHYIEFHNERKHVQATQAQIHQIVQEQQRQQVSQQSSQQQLPHQLVKNFQQRIQFHHQQMQLHYQKLQQLNSLMEEIQSKHDEFEGNSCNDEEAISRSMTVSSVRNSLPSPKSPPNKPPLTPSSSVSSHYPSSPHQVPFQYGKSFMVPPPSRHVPSDYMVPIQHGIPTASVPKGSSKRGRGSRGGKTPRKEQLYSPSEKGSQRRKGIKGSRGSRCNRNSKQEMMLCQVQTAVTSNDPIPVQNFPMNLQNFPLQLQQQTLETVLNTQSPLSSNIFRNQPLTSTNPSLIQNINSVTGTSTTLKNPFQTSLTNPLARQNFALTELIPASKTLPQPTESSTHAPTTEILPVVTVQVPRLTISPEVAAPTNQQPSINGGSTNTDKILIKSSEAYIESNDNLTKSKQIGEQIVVNGLYGNGKISSALSVTQQLAPQLNGHVPYDENKQRLMVNGDISNGENKVSNNVSQFMNGEYLREEIERLKPIWKVNTDHINHSKNNGSTDSNLKRKNIENDDTEKPQEKVEKKRHLLNFPHGNLNRINSNGEKSSSVSLQALQRLVSEKTDKLDEINQPQIDVAGEKTYLQYSESAQGASINILNSAEGKLESAEKSKSNLGSFNSSHNPLKRDNSANALHLELEHPTHITLCSSNNNDGGASNIDLLRKQLSSITASNIESRTSNIQQVGDRCFSVLCKKKDVKEGVFPCQWDQCTNKHFATATELFNHMVEMHTPEEGVMSRCKVKHCSSSQKPLGALICHFKEKHCSSNSVHEKEKMLDFKIEDESPVTRSVRYTSALIIRNLIRNASRGKEIVSKYESTLAMIAMSKTEATTAAVDCLYELNVISNDFADEIAENETEGNGDDDDDDDDDEEESIFEDESDDVIRHATTHNEEEQEGVKWADDKIETMVN